MVGVVVVSHSAALAAGVVELARQMAGDARIEAAGGMAEPEGALGTDAELVAAAMDRADAGDGVLVLMDLGSAVMSAELALEMREGEAILSEAPLVEGAVAAAARAATGATLAEVAAEARAALGMKRAQLGAEDEGPGYGDGAQEPPAPAAGAGGRPAAGEHAVELRVTNALGLHARPAARVVETAGRFDAQVWLAAGDGPGVDARSLSALITLGARQGSVLRASATGPEAELALEALAELARVGFGEGGAHELAAAEPAASPGPTAQPAPAPVQAGARPATAVPGPGSAPAPGSVLYGLAASPGMAIARARVRGRRPRVTAGASGGDPAHERDRLDAALKAAGAELERLRESTAARAGDEAAGIFAAQALLLSDTGLLEPVRRGIAAGTPAERAWAASAERVAAAFAALDEPYLRERASDVREAADRVMAHLTGDSDPARDEPVDGILVVADVAPGQVAGLDPERVAGIAAAEGGATSHAAILARALGIPAVMGLGAEVLDLADGTPLVLDGDAGTLEVAPGEETLARRREERAEALERRQRARRRAREPAVSADGVAFSVEANLGDPAELAGALEAGADGVGLLRTEFLFLDRPDEPTEEEQREVYGRIARAMDGRPLVIRTLDAGADKPLPYLRQAPEANPYLGLRGIRLGLARPDVLDAQLRALASVAAEHPLHVMFPMVSTLEELGSARSRLEAALDAAGAPRIPIGVMVEVPAVALQADAFAARSDFLSVGTNDLAQYVMAAERGHPRLGRLLAGPPPALLELVARVVAAAGRHGRRVAVCGELAGEPRGAALLAGLGVRELSMAPTRVPEIKELLRSLDVGGAAEAAARAREAPDAGAVVELAGALLASPGTGRR